MKNTIDMLNTENYLIEDKENVKTEESEKEDNDLYTKIEEDVTEKSVEEKQHDCREILNAMFDDSLIKTDTSPFMTYPDDRREYLKRTNYVVDLGKVIQQYRNGDIDERMLHILDIIIQHRYINTRQIWQIYLLKYKLYIKRESLNKILDRMINKGLIVGFLFNSSAGGAKYHTYCADYNGVRLHTALTSESTNWKRTDTVQQPYIIKRSLAKNQFLIAYLKYYNIDYKLQPRLNWVKENGQEGTVIPALQIMFNEQEKSENVVFLVEVIRTYRDWETDFSEKLKRYGEYMKSVEDTQALRKYYVIICAESSEQVRNAKNVFYNLRHVKNIREIRNLNLYYTHDIELLDTHFQNSLLENLRGIEYNYENKVWKEFQPDFDFTKGDWHNIEFEIDKLQKTEEASAELEKTYDKKALSKMIYKVVKNQGWNFPQSITNLAIPLKVSGIDYKEMGYSKLKHLFKDISEFYTVYFENPTQMIIDCTDNLREIMGEEKTAIIPNKEQKSEIKQSEYINSNIISDYFTNGIVHTKKWKERLVNDIYCFKNWEMTSALLAKMTHIYDFNQDGWLHILAYSYYLAKKDRRVVQNLSKTYICFDTGLKTSFNDKIYLLARKNYREKPEWLLEGISSINSRALGDIINKEFNFQNNQQMLYNSFLI